MQLASLTRPQLIFTGLQGSDPQSVLRALSERLREAGVVGDAEDLYARLWEREQLGSTGIGGGIAIPHCKLGGLAKVELAVGLTAKSVDFGAVDGQGVRLFFLVISPSDTPAAHLQCLAAISKWVKAGDHVSRLLGLDDPVAIHELLEEESG